MDRLMVMFWNVLFGGNNGGSKVISVYHDLDRGQGDVVIPGLHLPLTGIMADKIMYVIIRDINGTHKYIQL